MHTFNTVGDHIVVNGQSIIDILYICFITLYFMSYMLLHVLSKTFFLNMLCQILIPYCMSFLNLCEIYVLQCKDFYVKPIILY